MAGKKISIHMIFTGIYLVLIVVTLLPFAGASKECMLGYKALCSFNPISAIILLSLAGLHVFLDRKAAAKSAA